MKTQAARLPLQRTSIGQLINNSRQRDRGRLAHQACRKSRERRLVGIDFNESPTIATRPQRPIDDVPESRRRSHYDHNVASSAVEKIFNSLQFAPLQLFTEPDNTRAHERAAFSTFWNLLSLLVVFSEIKITARTSCHENVPVNLHHLVVRNSGTRVKVVHVLGDKQELVCMLGQSGDCFVCGVRLRVTNALPALAIPIPDELRIARESFRRGEFCRIEISPVALLAAKSRDAAFGGNTRASNYKNPHR